LGSGLIVLPLAAGVACEEVDDDPVRDPYANEFGVLLDALGAELPSCVDATGALVDGTLTLALAPGDDCILSVVSGKLKVNGHQCRKAAIVADPDAVPPVLGVAAVELSTNLVKKLVVEGASGASNSVLVDLVPGPFGNLFGPIGGITVNAGNGAAVSIGVRGTDAANRFKMAEATTGGELYLELSGDSAADMKVVGDPSSVVLTLGAGGDAFSAQDTQSFTFQGSLVATQAVSVEPITVYGGSGADVLEGGLGNDTLDGGDDNDTFQTDVDGLDGADIYRGGAGSDTIDYSNRTAGVTVDIDPGHTRAFVEGASLYGKTLNAGTALTLSVGGGGTITYTSAGQSGTTAILAELNAVPAFSAVATAKADDRARLVIEAKADDATIVILSDNQRLIGGASPSTPTRADTASDLADADDGATGADEHDDVRADVENIKGGPGDDVLTGSPSPNLIDGAAGNDDISGGIAGTCATDIDNLNGGVGEDVIELGAAPNCPDVIDGGAGRDIASYALRNGGVTVTLDNANNDGASEKDNVKTTLEVVLGGDGNDAITGGTPHDELHGGPGNDVLKGGAGDDTLVGGTGNDSLVGEAGDDYFDEGSSADTAYDKPVSAFDGRDTIHGGVGLNICDYHRGTSTAGTFTLCYSATATACAGASNDGPEGDNLTNCGHLMLDDGADSVTGSDNDDLIEGGGGADTIHGAAGNDRLFGDAGDDRLFGGEGGDALDGGPDQVSGSDGGPGPDICVSVVASSSTNCEI
jgi:Ca2+-binding RTX toxin-like protein